MANHPNRGKKENPARNPTPKEIKKARLAAGLSQAAAATLVHSTTRAWQLWEAEEDAPNRRRMHPGIWELFTIKAAALAE